MKLKHTFIGILSTCALGLASCDLNIMPESYIADINFYKNEAEVNTAVIGCYGGMHNSLNIEWALTELRSDNTRMNGTRSSNDAFMQLLALDLGTMDASNPNIRTYWEATYQNINNCNTLLNPGVMSVVEDEKKRAQFEGEALFIRAYHYFNLVRLFGPTFLVTEEVSMQESLRKDRSSVQAVYTQIINDLKLSVDDLQDVIYSSNDLGRATALAAKSLLAKVYLTLGNYEAAQPLLNDVVTAKGETLSVRYAEVFDVTKEMNDEIIFAVRYKGGSLGIGSPFANTFAPQNSGANVITGSGDGKNYPTKEISAAYSKEDLRKEVSMADTYYDKSKEMEAQVAYVKKYLSEVAVRYDAENDWPILRYADVLLMYAEVLNEVEGPSAGLKYLNLVRERAGLPEIESSEVTTRNVFRTYLEKERRLELAFENQRWFDLLRWGKAIEVVNKHIQETEWDFYSGYTQQINKLKEHQLILPIPQSVIDNNPGVITQNPNY